MKYKLIRIVFLIVLIMLFVATIILTNDSIREKINSGNVLSIVAIAAMIFVSVILIFLKNKT